MASALAEDVTFGREAFPEVDSILLVPTELIDSDTRKRPVDDVWAGALGDLMVREGQRNPIDVCRQPGGRFVLHGAGGHRLRGAQLREIEALKVRVWPVDADAAELREISDGLHNRALAPLDRARFIADAVEVLKRKAGIVASRHREQSVPKALSRAVKEQAEETLDTMSNVYGWSREVAAELGFSDRTIRRDMLLMRGLTPATVTALREARHPLLGNAAQLRALAKLAPPLQAEVVDRLTGIGQPLSEVFGGASVPKTVSAALAAIRGRNNVADPGAKRLSAFIGAYSRMSLAERKGALAELAPLLPANFQIIEGSTK